MTRATAAIRKVPKAAPTTHRKEIKPGVVAFKRARILEEASSLFFARGYEAATLEMLADRLSATKPFLYTYFKGKSAILSAICETGVQESLAALDRIEQTRRSPLDLLKASLREVSEIIVAHHEYLVIYQREMMNLDRADAQRILRSRHEFDLRIGRLIDDCVRDGSVTIKNAAAMSIWIGGLLSWITQCYRPGSKRSAEIVVDQAVKACLRLIGVA